MAFLDQLRGMAILCVLFGHTLMMVYASQVFLPWAGWFRVLDFDSMVAFIPFNIALAGVPAFFVVSGFCIHLSFEQQGRRWGTFFIRRAFRIYPAYLAALVLSIGFFMARFHLDFSAPGLCKQVVAHVLLVHNYSPTTISQFNGPFWSLAVEAQLYLAYPLLRALGRRMGMGRALLIVFAGEVLTRGASDWTTHLAPPGTTGDNIFWLVAQSPLGFWCSWSLGVYVADAYLKGYDLPFLNWRPWAWLALALSCFCIRALTSFNFLIFSIMSAVMLSQLLAGRLKAVASLLSLPGLAKIGLWSYSLYLLHQPLLTLWCFAIGRLYPIQLSSDLVALLIMFAAWLAILPVSVLWYKVFELPGIALGKRIIRRREGLGPPPAPAFSWHYGWMLAAVLLIASGGWLAAAKFIPLDPLVKNNRAWTLATAPEPENRNGRAAVVLAEAACQETDYSQTVLVGTLGAAYAEAGRFDEAIATAKKACEMAAASGNANLLKSNQELLQLYLKHEAFHQPHL